MNNLDRQIVVISGPSGVGKTTLCERLLRKERRLMPCITTTTRTKRKDEVNGRDYHFITPAEFKRRIKKGDFLEYVRLFGHYYGTPYSSLETVFRQGKYPLLRIEIKGTKRLRRAGYQGAYIFILPPNIKALRARLAKRQTETDKDFARRLRRAQMELRSQDQYDFKVLNDDLNRAVNEIRLILRSRLYKP